MAFIITWNEYRRHPLAKRRLVMEASRAATVAFVIFLLLSLAVGFLFVS
jgi:hypothetical protein